MNKENKMREIRIEKVTLNFGAGADPNLLEKGVALLKMIAGKAPVKTITTKRIPEWAVRPGLPLGCKLTLRGKAAYVMVERLLKARAHVVKKSSFGAGNFAFGIPEYIDMPDVKYNPDLGIMGFECAVTLMRPGFRIKCRKIKQMSISPRHKITVEDTIAFAKEKLKIVVNEE
jgi:large subunit ribosomal protein L5